MSNLKIGEKMFIARKRLGLTPKQMALRVGLRSSTYRLYETGILGITSDSVISEIFRLFNPSIASKPVTFREKFLVIRMRLGTGKIRNICNESVFNALAYGHGLDKHRDILEKLEKASGMELL